MGFSYSQTVQFLTMILTMIILLFSSVAHISSVSVDSPISTHYVYPPESFSVYSHPIGSKVPKEGSLLQNFRLLLGLKSLISLNVHHNNHYMSPSPSPSPSSGVESLSLSPSKPPMTHFHEKMPHPERHAFHSLPRPHIAQGDDGKAKRVLIAVLVSIGGVTMIGIAFLVFAWKKYNKSHNTTKRRFSVYGKKRRERSNKRVNKVSLNPGLDLFYVNSLGMDLEKQPPQSSICLQQTCEAVIETHQSPNRTAKPEFDNASDSSAREIISEHDSELVNEEHEKIIPFEESRSPSDYDDDDDQSFHSLVESNSSIPVRLSNASLGSFSDAMESFNSTEPNPPSNTPINSTFPNPILEIPSHASPSPPPPPPPPPPPLPPPRTNFLLPSRLSNSIASSSNSSALPSPSPPKEQTKTFQLNKHFALSPLNKASNQSPIPPPPCPPPIFKTSNAGSLKTPPPPPLPLGKDGSPLPKLKPLHWDKVRAASDQSMVWDKLRSSSFELDEEMIESLFGYNLQQNSMTNNEGKSKTPSPSKHVLEPKRLQNITILSKALSVTSEQVCAAILRGKGLSLQQLEALVKMVPTKEEETKLLGYEGNVNELGFAEKFVRSMLAVPFAFRRLQAMLFTESFEDEIVHLKNSFSMLEEACKELRSSRLFLKLLEAVLKTGNRMNVGTIRGGAKAFKLDALLKLADVKGTDGKTSLLHFVVQEIIRSEGIRVSNTIMGRIDQLNNNNNKERSEEDYRRMGLGLVSGLTTELHNVKRTAAIDLDVLVGSVSNLYEGLNDIRGLLKSLPDKDEFVASMELFVGRTEERLKEMKCHEDGVMSRVREIAEYFHGNNVGKEETNPLRIFVIVRDFLGMLDSVCKELRGSSKTPRSSPSPLAHLR